ncbi:hypothetical protein [Niabella beijingensis]|uniref:hypothetical protein n=1 Tax=Niabella beijingensis TaxID=2872700 RepID=UPI001CBFAD07|nr:hypothetical protein [Niabella beijingensis]MBZ4191425.1 hypothetical protein [Niabella beijingensis]
MNRQVRICYRKIIDVQTRGAWEQLVFEATYAEFLMQAQYFNRENKYTSYAQLKQEVRNADKLDFLVSTAITGYMQQLQHKIPDITNTLGLQFLPFSDYRFELLSSGITDKTRHRIAISFYSDWMRWLDTIGDRMLLSYPGHEQEQLTELFSLPPFVSIYSIKPDQYA